MTSKSKVSRALVGVAVLALSGYAMSMPTLVGTTTDPIGINGLVVDGVTYDVTFTTSAPNSPFTPGSAGGIDAAVSLSSALNSLGVTELLGMPATVSELFVDLAKTFDGNTLYGGDTALSFSQLPWEADSAFFITPLPSWGCLAPVCNEGVTFTSVPEPTTIALFGLGLAGIAVSRRRRAR